MLRGTLDVVMVVREIMNQFGELRLSFLFSSNFNRGIFFNYLFQVNYQKPILIIFLQKSFIFINKILILDLSIHFIFSLI